MKSILFLLIFHTPIIIFGQGTIQDSLKFEKIANSIESEKFDVSVEKKDIPRIIKRRLTKIDKNKFKLANGGAEFNSGDALQKRSLPNKRIVYIAYNEKFYIITYEQGGFGRAYYSRIIEYKKEEIKCITTLIMPPHHNINDFKSIIMRKKWVKYVSEKSLCF